MLDIFRNEREIRTLQAGEMLFQQGDQPANFMFAILEGEIQIDQGTLAIATLGPGEIVGEMGLIDEVPRSANARALSNCRVAVVPERRFLFLVQQHPSFALGMLRTLTQRLRAKSES